MEGLVLSRGRPGVGPVEEEGLDGREAEIREERWVLKPREVLVGRGFGLGLEGFLVP